jgi:long-subunit acyl-CoA synthetase (AMP-forming)
VGQPLPGLIVRIDDGDVVVDGPTVMAGYQNGADAARPWRTGDLGHFDEDGYLHIAGRKDNLIVTSYGRNVSPEWIEALLAADERIAACAVLGHGEPRLSALIIPSTKGATWIAQSTEAQVLMELSDICRDVPAYAIPRNFAVLDRSEAMKRNLLTSNGRFRRGLLAQAYAEIKSATARRIVLQQEEKTA